MFGGDARARTAAGSFAGAGPHATGKGRRRRVRRCIALPDMAIVSARGTRDLPWMGIPRVPYHGGSPLETRLDALPVRAAAHARRQGRGPAEAALAHGPFRGAHGDDGA